MNECDHIIGFLMNYEDRLITLQELKEHIGSIIDFNKHWKNEYSKRGLKCPLEYKEYKLKDYSDFRKSVNIQRFLYCPFCGKELNWKEMCKEE